MTRTILPLLIALAACSEDPFAALTPDQVLFGNGRGGPSASASQDRKASFFWKVGLGLATDGVRLTTIDGEQFDEYRHGDCALTSVIHVDNGGGDATSNTDGERQKKLVQKCGGRRLLTAVYPDGSREDAWFANANRIWWIGPDTNGDGLGEIQGGPGDKYFRLGFQGEVSGYCGFIRFSGQNGSDPVRMVEITAPGETTRRWRVESTGAHQAYCDNQGRTVTLPFALIVQDLGLLNP